MSPLEEAYIILKKRLDLIGATFKIPEEEREDLLQEGYIRLAPKDINNLKEAEGKLWVTVRNLSIDKLRNNRKEGLIKLEEDLNISCSPEGFYDKDIIRKQIKKLLTPLQFRIMTLLIKYDKDYPEIAKILGMKEGTVRTNVSRARKILKEKLVL